MRRHVGARTALAAALAVTLAAAASVSLAACGSAAPGRGRSAAIAPVAAARADGASPARTTGGSSPSSADAIGGASRSASATSARPSPCAARPAVRQLIFVSIAVQHAWLCARGRAVRNFPVTTGRDSPDTHTPIGRFHVQGRDRHSVLTLNDGRQYDVQYWIPFDAPDYGFHDASWQRIPFGSPRYRTAGSHGCVHLPLAAIRFLYGWVQLGASVEIVR